MTSCGTGEQCGQLGGSNAASARHFARRVSPTLRHDVAPGLDATVPAVVLKLDPNVMHHGSLGVIRSLGRLGVPVYSMHEARWAPAAQSRYVSGRYIWQPNPADSDQLIAGLRSLADRIGQPAVMIATDDAGAIFLAEHGERLRPQFLFPRPPAHLPRQLAGKYSMAQLCQDLGVPSPRAVVPDSLTSARDFAESSGYPLVAKLTAAWQGGGTLRSTTIVRDERQLANVYGQGSHVASGLMFQEFIPGGAGHDWFFHGYCGDDSTCRPAFTGVKVRSYPAHAGLTSLGRSAPNARLRAEVASLLKQLSYRGIVDVDIRWDARDDQYKLLDLNPRLGAQFRLFRDSAGSDVIISAYLDLTGQPIPQADQVDGRSFLVENYDPLAALSYWRSGELRLGAWGTSLRSIDETAWFARDDLRPFGLMCARMTCRLASRAVLGRRSRPATCSTPRYRPGRALAWQGAERADGLRRRANNPFVQAAGRQPDEEDARV
jgi:D-aspartate ligase